MPYIPESDQYYWDRYRQVEGRTFAPDGSDYDPAVPKPKLSDAQRYLQRHFGIRTIFQVTVVGYMLIYSSASEPITAFSFLTDKESIDQVSLTGTKGGIRHDLESKIAALSRFSFSDEARITGIYFRPLD